jgi:catechol 2,3-dioxygenase-like lactoylglutathione lyase family enzyme
MTRALLSALAAALLLFGPAALDFATATRTANAAAEDNATADQSASDWPSLELPALAASGKLPETVEVTVDDPVYNEQKTYQGYPLAAVLALIPELEALRCQGAVAIFEVADGYKAVISLDNALAPGGVIATRDLDAPRGPFMTWNDRPSAPGSASIQLAFRVPSAALEACHAELIAHGVAILREPTDLPAWRHRTIFFRDPADNLVEIYAEY